MEPNTMQKQPWVIRWALILGIVIVTNLFLGYLVKVVYNEPIYTNFCEEKQVRVIPETQDECVAVGGQWTEDRYIQKTIPNGPSNTPILEQEMKGYCDPEFTCRQAFTDANDLYQRNVFVILVIAGVLLIIGSMFLKGNETVAFALVLSGVLSLIIGSMRYWSSMDDYLRVIILGLALASLMFVAYKKFKDHQ